MQPLQLAGAALVGALAAVATAYFMLDTGSPTEPALEQQSVSEPTQSADGEELRFLHQRLADLERRQARGQVEPATPPLADELVEGEPPPPVDALQEFRNEMAHLDERIEAFEAQPVDAAWRAEVQPEMLASATQLVDGTDVAFEGLDCRQTTCRLNFTSGDRNSLLEISQEIASGDYGTECTTLVVTHEDDPSASRQSLTALLDCARAQDPQP